MKFQRKYKFKAKTLIIKGRDDLLGRGGQGRIFKVPQSPDLVAKIYHKPSTHRRKVEAMYENPPKDKATPGHISLAWPVDLLLNADSRNGFRGYLMKRIDNAVELHQVANPRSRKMTFPHFNHKYLHITASNIASAFAAAHAKGYIVGDVKDQNVLVNDQALVTLIDTDSFQVPNKSTGGVYRCTVGTPEFTPPELQERKFSRLNRKAEHDLFGLGVLIFQLIMGGFHPFNGVPDKSAEHWTPGQRISRGNFAFGRQQSPLKISPIAPSLSILHPKLRDLFTRCFEEGAGRPVLRPSAAEWKSALIQAASELISCSRDKDHLFGNHLKSCPWCKRNRKISRRTKARTSARPINNQTVLQRPTPPTPGSSPAKAVRTTPTPVNPSTGTSSRNKTSGSSVWVKLLSTIFSFALSIIVGIVGIVGIIVIAVTIFGFFSWIISFLW